MKLDFLSKIKDSIHFKININPLVVIPVIVLIGLAVGYGYFFITTINPAMQENSKVSADLANARKALNAPGRVPETNPDKVRAQLTNAKATLAAELSVFLSDVQATAIIDALAQYANASGVKISSLQAQPATGQKDLYNVSVVRLQVQGNSKKLVEFVARIKESFSAQGFVITNISLVGGEGQVATMTLDLVLFTSVYSSANTAVVEQPKPSPATSVPLLTSTPVPPATSLPLLPTFTPLPPTPVPASPTPAVIVYVVRQGDTLFSIAQRYGTTVDAIMALNRLPNFVVRVGQTLQIPRR